MSHDMKAMEIKESSNSPKVVFDPEKGMFLIRGKSTVENAGEFYEPILKWLDDFARKNTEDVSFIFDLDYFNIASSKRLLFILYKLNSMNQKNINVDIVWNYSFDDDDMREVGEDFAIMVDLPFEFRGYENANQRNKNLEPVL